MKSEVVNNFCLCSYVSFSLTTIQPLPVLLSLPLPSLLPVLLSSPITLAELKLPVNTPCFFLLPLSFVKSLLTVAFL